MFPSRANRFKLFSRAFPFCVPCGCPAFGDFKLGTDAMYSLYRAWLMRDAVAAASLASPPDLIITVGNQRADFQEPRNYGCQFVAHKYLVSMHSGYLKSLIQNESTGLSITNISLPNITSESFAPLLSFMYTGYLDLTNENIYSVLLATHLLHMPRALDLCRAYLVQNQRNQNLELQTSGFPAQNSSIIKPIPSRKINNVPQYIWSPVNLPPLMIQTRPDGPFQSVSTSEKKETSPERPKSPLAIPSTSKADEQLSASSDTSPSVSSFTSDEQTIRTVKSPQRKILKRKEYIFKNYKKVNNENLKVEYDIACCDGPVRFHRVLNESYGMSLDEIVDETEMDQQDENGDKISDKEYLENYPKTQFLRLKSTKNFSNYMHQQMLNSNSYKKSKTSAKGVIQMRKVIEKDVPNQNKDSEGDKEKEENPERAFTCVYCKHTFKSQYCYQKHTKRHINSVEDSKGGNKNFVILRKVVSNTRVEDQRDSGNVRREVRLLDMNVQYYPCKTCGSKFPSYYFVHKHRKLCHSNEENFDENSNTLLENTDSSSSDHLVPQTATQ